MRAFLFLVAVGVITWFATGGPTPGVQVRPLTPNPEIPTFQESVKRSERNEQAFAEAAAQGGLVEDPAMRARRQAVITAARKLDVNPCDKDAREELRKAVVAFFRANMSASDKKPVETMVVDGRVVDARGHFNREATDIMTMAFADGTLDRNALPFPLNLMAEKSPPHLDGMRERCPSTANAR
jgi:hypothetical protein